MKFSFVGDLFISRRISSAERESLGPIRDVLNRHDVKFGNLETAVLNINEGTPALFPGGGYAMAEPGCLDDLAELGINLFNAASNHAMDYGEIGCLRTIENLQSRGLVFAGIGKDLESASAPAFLRVGDKTVGLIGLTSSFHDSYAAGPSNIDVKGRPGVNPLRHNVLYRLPVDKLSQLKEIAAAIGINNYHNLARQQGYLTPSENFQFGPFAFAVGETSMVETMPRPADLHRTINTVEESKHRCDYLIVSIHSHQFKGADRRTPPDFITSFAKTCIDHGACIVVCHGPHIVRTVERYRNGVILHGVGNFIFQHEQQKVLPEEFYNKYGLKRSECEGPQDAYARRSKNGSIGIIASQEEWKSAIYSVDIDGDNISMEVYPVEISKATGLPRLV